MTYLYVDLRRTFHGKRGFREKVLHGSYSV